MSPGVEHTVRVPQTLGTSGIDSSVVFPEDGVLVFRGASEDHFCLGGDPQNREAFLDGLSGFAILLERLQRRQPPTLVICHGATRGGGMLFPSLGTAVLAHTDATFGFPEIRRGALPGVVSVAAQQELWRYEQTWM